MSLWSVDRRQTSVLADRYLDVMLGEPKSLLVLFVQAPLIAGLVAGVWSNASTDSPTLYFVLVLSAFFLGAVNSAREVVKERALFLRERMYNLSVGAYVTSKYRVQAISMVLQCVLLTGIVQHFVPMKVNVLVVGVTILLCALAGTSVGLLISALVRTPDKAVMMVPLVVIPQILFSELILPGGALHNWTQSLQKLMPVHWGFQLLDTVRADESLWTVLGSGATLLIIILVGWLMTTFALTHARY